jgi:hypothetical protein
MPRIDGQFAIKLMRIGHEMWARSDELEAIGVNVNGFECKEPIIDVLLDSFGFPAERAANDQGLIFGRHQLFEAYFDTVESGTDDEFRHVLELWSEMSKDLTPYYLNAGG